MAGFGNHKKSEKKIKKDVKNNNVKATGLRTRASSSYSPNQKEDF